MGNLGLTWWGNLVWPCEWGMWGVKLGFHWSCHCGGASVPAVKVSGLGNVTSREAWEWWEQEFSLTLFWACFKPCEGTSFSLRQWYTLHFLTPPKQGLLHLLRWKNCAYQDTFKFVVAASTGHGIWLHENSGYPAMPETDFWRIHTYLSLKICSFILTSCKKDPLTELWLHSSQLLFMLYKMSPTSAIVVKCRTAKQSEVQM